MAQKYPNLTKVTILRVKEPIEVVIVYKNKTQYLVCSLKYKEQYHFTENQLANAIKKAEIFNSPLMKAMAE